MSAVKVVKQKYFYVSVSQAPGSTLQITRSLSWAMLFKQMAIHKYYLSISFPISKETVEI